MTFGGNIKLTGESEYRSALKNITSDMKLMSSEMKVLSTSTDQNGQSSDADKAKKEALSKAIADQRDKLEALNKALADSNSQNGEASTSSKTLQTQINNATANLNRMETQLNSAGKETGNLGSNMDDTGKKAGIFGEVLKANLASDAIVAGVKKLADGIATIGKGVISMVGDSIKAYADYEQMVGGVETLFKDNAKQVEDYANTAYKTAGLSANQYMDTITSFSASLLKGLGGDTKKAAEVGNMAVTDMADNANKFGTDIGSIQNAYQGFAKANFTMLDNLKLGYGGSADGMAQLINNSGVMGATFKATADNVKDIPFDKMIEAIHKTQDALNITGTTAKEASSTISGSFDSVKASWQNVLAAMSGGSDKQMKQALDGMIDGVTNLVKNVSALLPNIVRGIAQLLNTLIQQLPQIIVSLIPPIMNAVGQLLNTLMATLPLLMPMITQLLLGIVSTIIQYLPQIIQTGMVMLQSLIIGLAQAMPTLIPAIVNAIVLIIETLTDNLDLLIDAGIMLLQAVVEGLIKALPILINKSPEIITKIVDVLAQEMPQIVQAGIELIVQLALGLIKAIPQLVSKIPEIMGALINGYKAYLGNMADVGKNLVEGLWNGINNATGWIMDKIKGFGKDVLNGIKSFFGIHSPSTVFADEVGKNLGLGVGVGFGDAMDKVKGQMQDAIPTSFDTGVNLNVTGAGATRAAAGNRNGLAGMFDPAVLGAALKQALVGVNVILDDKKVGNFVIDTVEKQVFAS